MISLVSYLQIRRRLPLDQSHALLSREECIANTKDEDQTLSSPNPSLPHSAYFTDGCCLGMAEHGITLLLDQRYRCVVGNGNFLLTAINECIIKEKLLQASTLNFTQGSTTMSIGGEIHAERGGISVTGEHS